jgi:hypothetical protein
MVKTHEEPHVCKVFVDKYCLLDGKDWEAGFVIALAHSIVVVPLLSWGTSDTGSVGQMVSLCGETDREDNVLLEFILTLALKSYAHASVQAIYPLLIGQVKQDGSFEDFPFAELQRLPATPSIATNSRAAKIMQMLGLPQYLIDDMQKRSVREIVHMMLRNQGCKLSQLDLSSAWQEECAVKILELTLREVRTLQDLPSTFTKTRPCGEETLKWLRECGLQQLGPVFISSGLGSLEAVATIRGRRLRELCSNFAQSRPSGEFVFFDEDLFARFEIMRDKLKKRDIRSRSMRYRLNRFVDRKVSWAAAFSSTCACEIAASGWRPQFGVACLLCFHILLFVGNRDPALTWQGKEREVARWAQMYTYPAGYLVLIAGLWGFIVLGLFWERPLSARTLLQYACLSAAVLNLVSPFLEIAQVYMRAHDTSWSLGLYFWNTEAHSKCYSLFVYEMIWVAIYFMLYWTLRGRQEYAVVTLYVGIAVLCLERGFREAAFADLSVDVLLFFGVFLIFCTLFLAFVQFRTRAAMHQAVQTMSSHSEKLKRIWEGARKEGGSGLCGALDLLAKETLEVEEALSSEERIVMARAWKVCGGHGLRCVFGAPQEGLPGSCGRYSMFGKVRQRCCNIDVLFHRAAAVNDTFQDHVEQLVQTCNLRRSHTHTPSARGEGVDAGGPAYVIRGPVKAPERVMEKCVRSYRRDVGCLSDLVRCTIVATTLPQVLEIFSELRSRSVVHSLEGETGASIQRKGRGWGDSRRISNEEAVEIGGGSGQSLLHECGEETLFRITSCKNRFQEGSKHFDEVTCFRNLSLNLEVGWVFNKWGACVLVPVSRWVDQHPDTLICEVQIHFESLMLPCENRGKTCSRDSEACASHDKGTHDNASAAHTDYIRYRDLSAR